MQIWWRRTCRRYISGCHFWVNGCWSYAGVAILSLLLVKTRCANTRHNVLCLRIAAPMRSPVCSSPASFGRFSTSLQTPGFKRAQALTKSGVDSWKTWTTAKRPHLTTGRGPRTSPSSRRRDYNSEPVGGLTRSTSSSCLSYSLELGSVLDELKRFEFRVKDSRVEGRIV
jgi:hypothetical protein